MNDAPTDASAARPRRIVLVDRDADERAELRRSLLAGSDRQYRFVEADRGANGVQAARDDPRGPPDCVLLGDDLPDLDVLGVLAALTGSDGLLVCPVVVLAGEAGTDGRAALRAGAHELVGKAGLTPEWLTRALESAAERWQMARERRAREEAAEEALQERESWLAAQKEALQAALSDAPLAASLDVLVRAAQRHLDGDARAAFYLADPAGKALHHVVGMPAEYAAAVDGIEIGPESWACGLAAHLGRPILTVDVTQEPRWRPCLGLAERFDFRGCWSFPIHTTAGNYVGTFAVYSRRPREATPRDLEFIARLTQTASMILSRHRETDERRRAEDALRESEERLRLALDGADLGSWDVDLRTGATTWNRKHTTMQGYPADAGPVTVTHWQSLVHPADLPRVLEAMDRAARDDTPFVMEHRFRRADTGEERWMFLHGRFARAADGTPVRFSGVSRDVTEARAAEESLRRSEARLSAVLESLPVSVLITDQDGRLVRVNRATRQIWGPIPQHECAADLREWTASWPDTGRRVEPHEWPITRALLTGESTLNVRMDIERFGGGRRHFEISAAPVAGPDGERLGAVVSCADVTDRVHAEQQLVRSAETFSRLVRGTPFGLYIVDADFRISEVSAGAEKVFASLAPAVGRDFAWAMRVLWPEPFASDVIARFRHTLDTGESYSAPTTIEQRADLGDVEAYDWKIERVTLADGRFGVVCYFYDLSERMRLAEALKEIGSFHRQTLELIPEMVFTNTPDGACDYVSEQWVSFTGVPAAEHLGDGWVRVLHPDDRARAFAAWRGAVEGRGEYDLEYRVRRRDGTYEWFKVRGHAIRDASGKIARWFGAAANIDGLKRTEAALQRRERELQTLADNTPEILTRFDRDLRHVFVNIAVERRSGRPREEYLGRTHRELGLPAELCDLWGAAIRAVFQRRRSESLQFRVDTPDGPRFFSTRLVPEFGQDGEVEYALGVTRDRTSEKLAADALEATNRRKDEFLATLAHELRNPLAPLRNGLQILRLSRPEDAAAARAREMMERQLSHLVRLVDDLLDVSRISRGKVELRRERITVRTVVDSAVEASRPLLDGAGHTLSVRLPDAPLVLDADPTRMVQVVSNLLNNSAKYTPDGGRIELSVERVGGEVVIRVTDTGIGIPGDMLPRVFDLFTQVGRSLDQAQVGLGIGLSLARGLVEMHGGSITAESRGPGQGSAFTVRLPLASDELAVAAAAGRHDGPQRQAPGRRILVVDDNLDGAESLAILLELTGHDARTATSGREALAMARGFAPELVFCDIGMPEMDGHEVARRFRGDPALRHTVLVALTGWGSEDDRRRAREAGFDLHLTKPVDAAQLDALLARLPPPAPE